MDIQTIRDILRRLRRLEDNTVAYRAGVITSLAPLSVALGGSSTSYTSVRAVDGLVLTTGDVVSVLTFGNDLLVLGRPATGPTLTRSATVIVGAGGAPAYTTGWNAYGGGYAGALYYKDGFGTVHVEGLVTHGSPATAHLMSSLIFTLPAGFRPVNGTELFSCWAGVGAGAAVRVDVDALGQVMVNAADTYGFLSLSGIKFRTT